LPDEQANFYWQGHEGEQRGVISPAAGSTIGLASDVLFTLEACLDLQ
jgi:hypothetical protein